MTNHLKSSIWGTKVKNSLEVADSLVTFGLDTSVRNWRGCIVLIQILALLLLKNMIEECIQQILQIKHFYKS